MSDLISRQAAIEALMKRDKELRNINWYDKPYAEARCGGIDEALDIVNALPSVHPRCDEWCTDCKEYDKEKRSCPRWNRVIKQTVEELKKQKTGRWIHKLRHSEDKQFDYYEESCSVCGAEARFWWRNFKYCPMCGAKMEGIKGETD